MRIYDNSRVGIEIVRDGKLIVGDVLENTTNIRCPFCGEYRRNEAIDSVGTTVYCNCGAKHKSIAGGRYWEKDILGEKQMLDLEIEHLKLILEGEKASRETSELLLDLAKQKITGRNRIIKSLRTPLKKNNVRTQA